jgi:xanthine dehydrogenase accessory factor
LAVVCGGEFPHAPQAVSELKAIVEKFGAARGPLALATAVRTTGSTYRRPGARLLLDGSGRLAGSLSSGCLEEEIAGLVRAVLVDRDPTLHSFDLRPRFGCHGTMDILIEPLEPNNEFLGHAVVGLRTRATWTAATVFSSSTRALGSLVVRGERPPEDEAFVQTIEPPIRLIALGDGLENEMIAALAVALGWETIFAATPNEIPPPDARTAVVVKAHKMGRDLAALKNLLKLPIPYVGLVGPNRRKQLLLSTLFDEGWLSPNASLTRLFGPAGLDLGAETPAEIALSIVAEIQAVMAGHPGGSLRNKAGAIHLPGQTLTSLQA